MGMGGGGEGGRLSKLPLEGTTLEFVCHSLETTNRNLGTCRVYQKSGFRDIIHFLQLVF